MSEPRSLPAGFDEYMGRGEGFDAFLGLEFVEVTPDRVRASLDPGPRHHQPRGLVHGGVYAATVETLGSVGAATWARANLDGMVAVGVANSTDFLRPHREGRLEAVAEPVHRGRVQQLWQVTIVRADDTKLVARGQLRVQNVPLDEGEVKARA